MKYEISRDAFPWLVEKWNDEWKGAYIQNMRAIHEDAFVVKIHTKEGNKQWLIALPSIALESAHKWETLSEQPPVVNATKDLLENARIEKITQLGEDRVLRVHLENAHLIIELFGGGNLIATDAHDVILFVHHAKEWRGRTLKMKQKYSPPQNVLQEDEKKEHRPKRIGFQFETRKEKRTLVPVFEKGIEAHSFETIFEEMEHHLIEEWKQPRATNKTENEKHALQINLERQHMQIHAWEKEAEEKQHAGEWMYEHYTQIESLLEAVQRGIKQKISESKMTEEIGRKLPFVKKIDTKKRTIELELNEK